MEEGAERGIRWWSRQFDTQSDGQNAVVADGIGEAFSEGVALQISQALATAQDSQHGYQQQIPGWKANPAPHPRIRDRPQVAYQAEIGGGRSAFGHKEEAIPPTSTHADSPDKVPCDGLSINPAHLDGQAAAPVPVAVAVPLLGALVPVGTNYSGDLKRNELLQAVARQLGEQFTGSTAIQ